MKAESEAQHARLVFPDPVSCRTSPSAVWESVWSPGPGGPGVQARSAILMSNERYNLLQRY